MYFTIEQSREIVRRSRCVAEYIPGVGAHCIFCGSMGRDKNFGVKRLVSGTKRRYFTCDECGKDFVVDELVSNFPCIQPQTIDHRDV